MDGNSYSSRLGTTRKQLGGDRELAGVTVGKDGGRHDLDADFSKGVEYIASNFDERWDVRPRSEMNLRIPHLDTTTVPKNTARPRKVWAM